MGYYICGYSDSKIVISKSLTISKCIKILDNKIYYNVIFTESVFDLSINIDNKEDYNIFIINSNNINNIYTYLFNLKNNKNIKNKNNNNKNNKNNKNIKNKNINILTNFLISYNNLNYVNDIIYFTLLRQYPYNIIVYNILISYLPYEIIRIILKMLDYDIIVSFKIDKGRRKNNYFLCLPNILY